MLNLMLHCGANLVDRAQVEACATPQPTDTWQPIPHAHLLQLVEQTLTATGMQIVNQAHSMSREGHRYFSLMKLTGNEPDATETSGEYGLVVGLRNSHDQTFPAGLVVGSGVFICDNLAFSGQIVLARRHTRFIVRDLPQLVSRAVGMLGDLCQEQDRRIDTYQHTQLDDRTAHDLLIQCLDARVLPATRLPAALHEWRRPLEAEQPKSAWRLFNAVTEAIKGRSLDELPRRSQSLHGLMDAACGLACHRN